MTNRDILDKLLAYERKKDPDGAQARFLSSPGGRKAVKQAAKVLGMSFARAMALAKKREGRRSVGRPAIVDSFSDEPCAKKRWRLRQTLKSFQTK